MTGIYPVFSNFVSHIDFISFVALLLSTGLRVHNLNWTSCPLILILYATCYRIPMQSADYDDDFPRFGATEGIAGGISILTKY